VLKHPSAIKGTDAMQPEIHKYAFVIKDFFSNLSAIIPPANEAAIPQTVKAKAFKTAYSPLKAGKFLPKNTGKNVETIIPPKFLRELAINVFLAHDKVKTKPRFSTNDVTGFLGLSNASFAAFSFFSFSFNLVASSRYLPLSGS